MRELPPKQPKPFEIKEKWHSSKVVSHWERLLINCAFGVIPRKDFRLRLRESTRESEKDARLLSPFLPSPSLDREEKSARQPSSLTKKVKLYGEVAWQIQS